MAGRGTTHNLGEPCQGRQKGRRGISLAVDAIEDKDDMGFVGFWRVAEHVGQLEDELGDVVTS